MALLFVGLLAPTFNRSCLKSAMTKNLAQAKQVGLALKLFAEDHNGEYPRLSVPVELTSTPGDSNLAFACLFPTYVTSETIFCNPLSAYNPRPADNIIDPQYTGHPKETLQPGENVYSYVMGLNDADNSALPLVADGTDGTGHYQTDPSKRGGTWKGQRAIMIRLDNSSEVEVLAGPANARYIPTPGHPESNLLNFSHSGRNLRLLDPAVGPRRQ